jgi:hypothetical protein
MVGWADDDPPRRRRLASGLVSHGGGRPTAGRLIVNPDATGCAQVLPALCRQLEASLSAQAGPTMAAAGPLGQARGQGRATAQQHAAVVRRRARRTA